MLYYPFVSHHPDGPTRAQHGWQPYFPDATAISGGMFCVKLEID